MISWITSKVAIGDWSDAYQLQLQNHNLHVLNLSEWKTKNSIWNPITENGNGKFKQQCNQALNQLLKLTTKGKVLVHCIGGIDRSPFIVALYLMKTQKLTKYEAYALIKQKRPNIIEHYEWFHYIC